ncbi:MAG: sigma-70 family RNA polymerase sigma factor [Tannerella sp.]|jgi:RNA polymerase sigma-70 factor (ECF subfamily)|nr:sigma-70 family RNA polymerase sigma factor [Tannerella sp.]
MHNVANPELLRYRNRMSDYGNIIRGVRERNPQSQMMFYDLFIRSVYRSAYSIVGNENEAEEIAQDTMLKAFDRIDLLNDDAGDMERIMRRIALNAAIDATRRRKNFIFSCEDIPDAEDTGIADDEYDFSIEEIKEAVAILSDTYRGILYLRLFENMSFAEIADMLKINCSTARVQYTRGIAKLRDFLIKKRSYV